MTTIGGSTASSDPKVLPGHAVFVPRTQASIRAVTEGDYDDDHKDVKVQPSVFLPEVLREAKVRYVKFNEQKTSESLRRRS